MKILKFVFLPSLLLSLHLRAQSPIILKSPDSRISFIFKLINNAPYYSVDFKEKQLIDTSFLRLNFQNGLFQNNLKINSPIISDSSVQFQLFAGKASNVRISFSQLIIPLEETVPPFRKINIKVRVFNDGLAFRYEIPKQDQWIDFILTEEMSTFHFTGNPSIHSLFFGNYTSSHEGVYKVVPLNKVVPDTLMDMPALFEYPEKIYVAITEAALLDYAGMYLIRNGNTIQSKLSPLPGQTLNKVKASLPHNSPWRVMLISDRIGDLIESNIITSLNEPCKINDISWIKPGKTTFPWWNGNVLPDTINAPGNNFVTAKNYIDFCALNHIQYHSVVEYGLHQWYMDDGVGFQPGPHSDVTTPVPGLDMKEICDYGKSKGVGIRVWVHWAALYPKLDSAFSKFEKWGISGMMVDFMDRDDQEMVNIQTEMLQKAATHHMHIQFHGSYKPTGINRTYPNEFTREGTLNYEANKWNDTGITPDHDITIPFTRGLAGSTDYHLGGFRAVPANKFRAQYTRPLMLGTRCHMLAMYVVLENYLQMVCDYPAAYENQPGFSFIKVIPTTWDETKVIEAKIDEYIIIARRKGKQWYLGAITNHQSRVLNFQFNFLDKGNYKIEGFSDGKDAKIFPNRIILNKATIHPKDNFTLSLASGGGAVMIISPL